MSEIEGKVSRELARRDLDDIAELKKSPAFNRYWLRRLQNRRDKLEARFRDDPPERCDKEEREILRRIIKEFDGLAKLMSEDEAGAQRWMEAPEAARRG